jgi:putative hydrolase of the HAD superfamily
VPTPKAIIFDLGYTLVEWATDDEALKRAWAICYDALVTGLPDRQWPDRSTFIQAMREAEEAHWQHVVKEQWSGPPSRLIHDGMRRLGRSADEQECRMALDGYARAIEGWIVPFPDAYQTLSLLRSRGYRLGLLSNTWWAAEWHHAALAPHGLVPLLDAMVYTSDLPHSKPHPTVFLEVATRLGVEARDCVMVGDRMVDDIGGALSAGMAAIWIKNDRFWPQPEHIVPTASIKELAELPALLDTWRSQ